MPFNVGENRIEDPLPLVSILIPAYKHEKFIIECLNSVRQIEYDRLELLVCDDCSPDNTFRLAQQWVTENWSRFVRCEVFQPEQNGGIVRSLNRLFTLAQGKYIAYIASDDVYLPTAISRRVEILQADRTIDAIFANSRLISGNGETLKERFISRWAERELSHSRTLLHSLLLNWQVPGPSLLLRKSAVEPDGSLGILPEELKAEDKYTYVRLAAKGKLRYIPDIVAGYRWVEDSMSRPVSVATRYWRYSGDADKINRPLLGGFAALIADARIARCDIELSGTNSMKTQAHRIILRAISLIFKLALQTWALIQI